MKTFDDDFVINGTFTDFSADRFYGHVIGDDGAIYWVHASRIEGDVLPARGTKCVIRGIMTDDAKNFPSATQCIICE